MPQNPVASQLFVSQIKVGTGLTVSDANGTGVVTLNVAGAQAPTSVTGGATPFPIKGQAAATATSAGGEVDVTGAAGGATSGAGGPAKVVGGAGTAGNSAGGEADLTGGAGQGSAAGGAAKVTGGVGGATGAGGEVDLVGGAGGATSGTGGAAKVTGGAAAAGSNANGGDVTIGGGAKDGTGVNGVVRISGLEFVQQGAPTAATVSALLTAAALLAGIITVLQGAAGASAQQLPLATALDTALPSSVANDAFDFSVINISTNAAESASLTTNTGWTLVGDMDIAANSAATTKSAGRFRARKTAAGAWTMYRLS